MKRRRRLCESCERCAIGPEKEVVAKAAEEEEEEERTQKKGDVNILRVHADSHVDMFRNSRLAGRKREKRKREREPEPIPSKTLISHTHNLERIDFRKEALEGTAADKNWGNMGQVGK